MSIGCGLSAAHAGSFRPGFSEILKTGIRVWKTRRVCGIIRVIESPSPISAAVPVLCWLSLQLTALSLSAMKTPFSLQFPRPEERMALEEMLFLQVGAAALFFPWLLRDRRTIAMIVITSWPFTVLAGMMSAQIDPMKIAGPATLVSGWIIGLALCNSALRHRRARFVGIALAAALAFGGPLLWYLRAEFRDGVPNSNWKPNGWLGPIMCAWGLCNGSPRALSAWEFLATFLFLSLSTSLISFGISRHWAAFRPPVG